ncbi:DUF2846 domain-containing protein [Aliarcobacter lanthieri]|uniref:DUF2846 domain-containing protein n=1 Tax=Aliarcobacter lanthieri TaxID=1355374 RepID=UPI00047E1A9E|nr:DUF2846 domain-containing protein [Aliarcobacter lanthieri]QKF59361.1 DUF2846 domain-containing protein [Aliarcobacter lanthieri]
MKNIYFGMVLFVVLFSGCASVKMDSAEASNNAKKFNNPNKNKSGLYIYRDSSHFGGALKKKVYINDNCIGETAPSVFFYEEVDGDKEYKISTQSEFSNNDLLLKVENGKNYYIRQYIKFGVFIHGADLELIDEEKGKEAVSKLDMALKLNCNTK